jgi:ABC-2 type transport system permease protein
MMKQVIVLLLSGATVPLAFFPDTLRNVVDHLPFQAIYNAPLTLLLDGDPDMKDVCITLGTQLAWCVGMFIVSKLFWKCSIKQITVNGG